MSVLITDGCPEGIHYRLHEPSVANPLPPLVLVHGAGGNLMHWPGELRRLPGSTVIALDLPGHGRSGGAALYDIAAYAQVVANFATGLSLTRFVLAGHSMGGAIAVETALRNPEMLAGLVLVATGARLPVDLELLNLMREDWKRAASTLACWSQGRHEDPRMMRIYLQRLAEVDPELVRQDYAACNAWDRTLEVGNIKAPALVICGEADRLTPLEYSLDLYGGINVARLVVAPGAGHMVMLEQPAFVAEAVRQFLEALVKP